MCLSRMHEGHTSGHGVASHARDVALVQVVHLLLHLRGQLVDVVRAVGALELPVSILAAQVAVLVVLQRACHPQHTVKLHGLYP